MMRLVNNVGAYLHDKGILKQDDLDVFVYGMDLVLFSLISILSLLALGMLTRLFAETVLCLLAFIPLQITGGGYHAKTHFRCYLTTLAGWSIGMLLYHVFPTWVLAIFMLQGAYTVFRYAPIEHANAPMSARQKEKMRGYARRICVILSLITISTFGFQPVLSVAIAVGMGMYGVSANAAYLLKSRAVSKT
jgi:accessory gene regulator B